MPGIVNVGGKTTYVKDLAEAQAVFGKAMPHKVNVFGFERIPNLAWITATTKKAHASVTLYIDIRSAARLVGHMGWTEPTVWARSLPYAAGLTYMDDAPKPEPEPEPVEEPAAPVRRVRRVRLAAGR